MAINLLRLDSLILVSSSIKTFLSLALALLAVAVHAPVEAQAGKPSSQATQREALVQSLVKGRSFSFEGQNYQALPDVRVMRAKKKDASDHLLSKVGATREDLIERNGALLYFRRTSADKLSARAEVVNQHTLLPVAVQADSGQFVMLPGSIIARPKDMQQSRQIAADHGLRLTGSFDHLGIATFEVSPGQDVVLAAQTLARDGRVSRAEPEVIAALPEPR